MTNSAKHMLPTLNTPWAIGEQKYSLLMDVLAGKHITEILEFGSGASTVRLSHDFPEARLTSIENDVVFYSETVSVLRQHEIKNAIILHCPLKFQIISGRLYFTYGIPHNSLQSRFDFVLIDGPVESGNPMGREGVLYRVFPILKIGTIIALDDYRRLSSQRAVQNWLNSFPCSLETVELHPDIAILRKTSIPTSSKLPDLRSLSENWSIALRIMYSRWRRSV